MNWDAVGAIAEGLGAIAVLVSFMRGPRRSCFGNAAVDDTLLVNLVALD